MPGDAGAGGGRPPSASSPLFPTEEGLSLFGSWIVAEKSLLSWLLKGWFFFA